MKTKLQFQVSRVIEDQPAFIIKRILFDLDQKHFIVQSETSDSVAFVDDQWRPQWRHEAFARLDGGVYRSTISEKGTLLTLDYYISYLQECLFLIGILCLAIFVDPYISFLSIVILVGFLTRIFVLQGTAKAMIERCASSNKNRY